MDALVQKLDALAGQGRDGHRLCLRVFRRIDSLPPALAAAARHAQAATAGVDGLRLNIALGYSGRDELVDATRGLVRSLVAERVPPAPRFGR